MSTTTTSWVLELIDKVSAPLRSIQKSGTSTYDTIDKINDRIKVLDTRSSQLSKNLKRMTVAAGAIALLGAGAVQFEDGMARANTMAQVGERQLAGYTSQIKEIATVVPIAKQQLSEGLYNTISAGVPKDNWITFLRDSSKAAIAGNADLGLVVDATASSIKAYGDSWENASLVQDRFQKTVELGQIPSLQALATALPRVTAVGAKLKVSQQELLGVFATASGVMGAPAEVATQFSAVLSALLKPGSEAIEMAKNLGIAFDAKSIGRAGGLQNYINQLMPRIQAFADKTGTTQEEIIGKLFGSQEAIKLVIGLGGELAQSWTTNTAQIGNAAGSVQKAFEIMKKTTKSQMILMKNAWSNVVGSIFTILAPFIKLISQATGEVAQWIVRFMEANPVFSRFVVIGAGSIFILTGLLTAITLVSVRLNLMHMKLLRAALSSNVFTSSMAKATLAIWNFVRAGARQLVLLAGQATGYLLSGAYLLGSFIVGLISATAAQWGLNVAMNANPIGLIVLGIAAVIAIIVVMVKYWDNIKAAIAKFTAWAVKNNPFEWLVTIIDKVFPGFREKIERLKEWVKNLLLGVWESIKKVWQSIKEFFGFGDDSTEVEIKVTNKTNPEDIDVPNPTATVTNLGNGGADPSNEQPVVSGDGKGAKILTMNLDIVNNFNLSPGNWKGKVDELADEIVGRINDRLRDGAIALN
ncbi:phage tail tape measure protein [Allomuricauda sp. M10]|uniref:phage tail tape measure protein n=1 Tax=Allomuricauda sp. M10 TaxID=2683292 RepID=UPI001D18CC00|nr:phage tail tape measure protein [Muricauda sp. M10]